MLFVNYHLTSIVSVIKSSKYFFSSNDLFRSGRPFSVKVPKKITYVYRVIPIGFHVEKREKISGNCKYKWYDFQ